MLDAPQRNKAIQTPPAKKGYHFPRNWEYEAEFVEAENIQEATDIYHRIKRPINPNTQSTPLPPPSPEKEVE